VKKAGSTRSKVSFFQKESAFSDPPGFIKPAFHLPFVDETSRTCPCLNEGGTLAAPEHR
jgi:hypothetical protein